MTKQTNSIIRTITCAAGAAALIMTTTACGAATDTLTSVFQQVSQGSKLAPTEPVRATQPDPLPAGWVVATDEPTGFAIALPAATKVDDETFDGVRSRMYAAPGPRSRSSVVFAVMDLPPDSPAPEATEADGYLDDVLSGMNDSVSQVTSSQHLVVDGRPTLDGRFASSLNGKPATMIVRFQIVGEHIVEVLSAGPQAEEGAVNAQHQRALSTLHLPELTETAEADAVPAGAGSTSVGGGLLPDAAQPRTTPATWEEITDAPSGIAFKLPAAPVPNVMTHGRGYKADGDATTVVSLSVYDSLAVSPDESIEMQTPEGMTVAERSDTTVEGHAAVDARLTGSIEGAPCVFLLRTIATDSRTVSLMTGGAEADDHAVELMHRYLADSVRIP